MNGLLAGSLSLLWLSAGQVPAEPVAPSGPVVTLGKPVAQLGKPKAIDPRRAQSMGGVSVVDRQVQPVTFSSVPADAPAFRPQNSEPLPLPRNPAIENSLAIGADPAADLGPMPRVGSSSGSVISTNPLPAAPSNPGFAGNGLPIPPDAVPGSVRVYSGTPGAPVSPNVGGGVVNGGAITTSSASLAACDNLCTACEEGKRHLLPFFEGGCTDYGNPPSRFWISAEYLLWNIKNQQIPALVTTSPNGTPQALAGVLPQATTLFPSEGSLWDGLRSGARLTMGMWFTEDQCLGIESSSFFLGQNSNDFVYSSAGVPILARPFTNVPTSLLAPLPGQLSELVAFPGVLSGSVSVHTSSQLYGTELNLRSNLWRNCCWRIDAIGGFRYVNLNESISITENLAQAPTAFTPGGPVIVNDSFETTNNFYGGQFGLDMGFKRGRWSLDLLGKIGIGDMYQSVRIDGTTAFPSLNVVAPGGLLAQPSNIGTYDRHRLAFVPEGGLKVGFQATQHCRLFVGYTFMYLSDVVRPGDQIDTRVDLRQVPVANFVSGGPANPGMLIPPATLPGVTMKRSDFWAQGVNFGVEFKF